MMQLSHVYHVTVTWMYPTVGGLDYKKGPYDIEFEPGEMKKAAQVSIDDDTEPEVTESFFVSISVPEAFTECGVSALSAARQIQIADNDAVSVEFDPVEYRVGEAGGVVELTLVTSSVVIRDGVVTIQTNTGNATGLPSVVVYSKLHTSVLFICQHIRMYSHSHSHTEFRCHFHTVTVTSG